ncbi:hypothetical protein EJ074_16600 [Mesorhizobium sp. M3A.F.Ca.ET.080.04.2.1]|uniref:hypothetical protein n=1 Tax=Mesorhizobium sp. M3A.F.Ca.ET.080.04.2.1 TaxID=2493676 RepID=UPI000F75595B|nr:hypothetical protein [Mesorhizobium sp. M3A.F.Ca.ET.080.04.2.1]AZO10570.1 hypothetical protein EJ074_16600 [Mesorhizobium sp. M3A.F.Ca.ET.080.04.2.1]RWF25665.1 MAG: hypothetical protein EOS64_03860 [Mesorhizobium sp.]
MKHQYVGDISDYRKYALLRALSWGGANRIGVCWMLTTSDGSSDGGKLAYLQKPDRYRQFDPQLFDILAHAAGEPDRRRLQTIEESGAVRDAAYFSEPLPDDKAGRAAFMDRCLSDFDRADIVFFDPDNGLEMSLAKGRKNSSKYLYLDEVVRFYGAGKSLLIYQHFPRVERSSFLGSSIERLRKGAADSLVWTFTTAHVVFFLVIHPQSPARLAVAAMEACRRWDASFIGGEYIGRATLHAA